MRVLVTGWFSFEQMGASAGDLLARDLVCSWLKRAGCHYDVAVAAPFSGGIDWRDSSADDYDAVLFICGPFGNGPPVTDFLEYFSGVPLFGLNLSMLQALDVWNPFQLLLERDSSEARRPDLVFLSSQPKVPVAGLILVHPQEEYGERAMHKVADAALQRLIKSREMAVIPIDTRLDENQGGLRTPGEVESLIAKTDVVITTRLHGMVLAIKNGVPPLVVDPIAGGAKILRQAGAIDWPVVFTADTLNQEELETALNFCLSDAGRQKAAQVYTGAVTRLAGVQDRLIAGLNALEA
ncbi:MAG: polysaccharide pyruvyl transferase family protein [Pseudomonadota bacterium]|nr:polysaccharide pyruvyl transferase family protein [Pseudomonadota bacterium]